MVLDGFLDFGVIEQIELIICQVTNEVHQYFNPKLGLIHFSIWTIVHIEAWIISVGLDLLDS